jgi:hypothetical protein
MLLEAAADSKSLFIAGISRDTKTYTVNGLIIKLGLLR